MLDPVLEAVEGLDVTVLYCTTVHPLDAETLRGAVTGRDVIVVEPYLEGTSTARVMEILRDSPRRILALGVPAAEHRHYGTAAQHRAAHGLDSAGLRARIEGFLRAGASRDR
jgi:transketolase